jgi:molybdopterin-synthase adenylyltransferase
MLSITVVGLGAIGSNLVLGAREIPGVQWRVVDFDRVESKNTRSQFHPRMVQRRNKAQALQQTMHSLFGLRDLTPFPTRLTADNADQLLTGSDLVVDCLDNAGSRLLLIEACARLGITHVHAGLAEDGSFAIVRWGDAFTVDDESAAGAATCEAGEHTPFILLAASQLAVAVQRFCADGSMDNYNITPDGVLRI